MHICPPFIPHAQPPELVQPGDGALDHPARHAKVTAVTGAALADLWRNPALAQLLAHPFRG